MARPARQLHIRQEPPCCTFEEAVQAFAEVSLLLARAEARQARYLTRDQWLAASHEPVAVECSPQDGSDCDPSPAR